MKLLTVNFLTCAVKSCKSSLSTTTASTEEVPEVQRSSSPFPLHFRDAVLERSELPFNALFIRNILPRVNWEALRTTATELGLLDLLPKDNPADDPSFNVKSPVSAPNKDASTEETNTEMEIDPVHDGVQSVDPEETSLRQLHSILLETSVSEGKLLCGKCGFEYPIKEGVANFLLPAHLV